MLTCFDIIQAQSCHQEKKSCITFVDSSLLPSSFSRRFYFAEPLVHFVKRVGYNFGRMVGGVNFNTKTISHRTVDNQTKMKATGLLNVKFI